MNRRFRLQSLLNLRQATEELRMRSVRTANMAHSASLELAKVALDWIEESQSSARTAASITVAELSFNSSCISSRKEALRQHAIEHSQLAEALKKEIATLQEAHQQTAMLETLRDIHLEQVRVQERRREQLSLDESFRLISRSTSGKPDRADRAY